MGCPGFGFQSSPSKRGSACLVASVNQSLERESLSTDVLLYHDLVIFLAVSALVAPAISFTTSRLNRSEFLARNNM